MTQDDLVQYLMSQQRPNTAPHWLSDFPGFCDIVWNYLDRHDVGLLYLEELFTSPLMSATVKCMGDSWLEGTWLMWLRNRLPDVIPGCNTPNLYHLTCELNCFFLYIDESPFEQLMLHVYDKPTPREKIKATRSRITRYQGQIKPVDVLAAVVGPIQLRQPKTPRSYREDRLSDKPLPSDSFIPDRSSESDH